MRAKKQRPCAGSRNDLERYLARRDSTGPPTSREGLGVQGFGLEFKQKGKAQ